MSMSIVIRFALISAASLMLSGCLGFGGGDEVTPAMKALPAEAQVLLAKKGMKQETPIFVRIFKEESELEIWKLKDDGRFHHFKTYPICAWSGTLGPKVKVGDKQAPEGFYTVTPSQMNPNSQFHLAFNLGFPNAYDKANGRTGDALMVHGDCRSAGCFAMTDALIEEIYILAREAFQGGQRQFQVHAFPFRMTEANLVRHKNNQWYGFWKTLKEGYDSFQVSQVPPKINICSRQYLVNANFLGQEAVPDPDSACPAYRKVQPQAEPAAPNGVQANTAPTAAEIARVTAAHSTGQPLLPVTSPANVTPSAAVYPGRTEVPLEKKPVETHGIHNVVGSGKGDMPNASAAPAPQSYSYGQANTGASASAASVR